MSCINHVLRNPLHYVYQYTEEMHASLEAHHRSTEEHTYMYKQEYCTKPIQTGCPLFTKDCERMSAKCNPDLITFDEQKKENQS